MRTAFTLNGVNLTKDVPHQWDLVSFGQYLDLLDCKTRRERLSVLTGIDKETLKGKIVGLENLLLLTAFAEEPEKMEYFMPKKIHILGTNHEYPIAENLELEQVDRYSDLEGIVKEFKDVKEHTRANAEKLALICATYAVNPYDYKTAENLAKEFFNAPCTEVVAVGNFTVVNILRLKRIIPRMLPLADTHLNRLKLALRNWARHSVSTLRFYLWKRRLPISVRRYLNGPWPNSSTI